MARKKTPDSELPEGSPSFEQALARVATIVEQLESGELTLAESLSAYEDAIRHIRVCQLSLDDAERKIELLSGFDAAGNPVTQPFDDTATSGDDAIGKRPSASPRPRKAPANKDGDENEQRGLFS